MTQPVLKKAEMPGEQVVAQYWAESPWWNDVPEAQPRCRVRVPDGSERKMVRVFADGTMDTPEGVIVDVYEDFPLMTTEDGR